MAQAGNEKPPVYNFDQFRPWLEKQNDTLYVINFWATWCKPCVAELPNFERIDKEYADRPVKVVLASLDFPKRITSQLIPFIHKNNITATVVVLHDPDANRWIPLVNPDWSGTIPATLIYKNDERTFYEGQLEYEELKSMIQNKLGEK
ncbi:MAG: TlpA disulfide reductase family protein [Bacteroidales bacterium]